KLVMRPIGLTARSLNRSFDYGQGPENQLRHWTSAGILTGAPGPDQAPRMAVWNNPATGTLDQRARAWLEMNCAHCHNPAGPARVSGLDLRAGQIDLSRAGVWKSPVAAGRGSGGRWYDIIPNKPNDSIVPFRIASTEPGVMMPELGRRLVDEDGLALIRSWIAAMPDPRKQ
ncbi:MAG: SO2930 family diheme c-type cytochrome, partial [Candidatus Acidiferrum sp.]